MQGSPLSPWRDRLSQALSLATQEGASAAIISLSQQSGKSSSFESGRLKECQSSDSMDYSIGVIVSGRSGVANGNIPEALPEMVKRAVALAASGADAHFDTYPEPGKYQQISSYDPAVLELTREKGVADCQSMVDRLKAADSRLDISAESTVGQSSQLIANSSGLMEEKNATAWSLGLAIQKTVGTDMMFSHAGRGWRQLNELYDPDYLVQEILFDLEHSRTHDSIADGHWPVFLPSREVGRFLMPVALGINGRNVFKGDSPLKDQLGKVCFAENLSILDNPHLDYSFSANAFDSAGIPTQKRWLVENGVLNTFLYDLDTACLAGKEPTGNSACSPYTMLIKPGTETAEEMRRSIKKGIYLKGLIGFGQSNIINGDFSANLALGYLIENGEIKGRLKNVMLAGNILDLLRGEVRISSDCDPQNKQPAMILNGVNVVSARG